MKLKKLSALKKKLSGYDTLIFDLDDTIYFQHNYDTPALGKVSFYLSKIINKKKEIIFKDLRRMKPLRRGKKPNLIFNKYLLNKIKNKKQLNKIIRNSVQIFQNYDCKELKTAPSIAKYLKTIYNKKNLFLVTNGNKKRQKKKLKYLGITKLFKKIFVLDGITGELKPSIKSVKYLSNYLKSEIPEKVVFIGDNNVSDKEFAKNLKIDFIHFEFTNL